MQNAHLFVELVVGALVEEDHVVELVANLSLRPLLLLCLASSGSFLLLAGLGRIRLSLGVLLGRLQRVTNMPTNVNSIGNIVLLLNSDLNK